MCVILRWLGGVLLIAAAIVYSGFLQDILSGGLGTLLGAYLVGEITYVRPEAGSEEYVREEQLRARIRVRFVALSLTLGFGIPLLARVAVVLTRLLLRVRA